MTDLGKPLPITSAQIHAELEAIAERRNEKLRVINRFPPDVRNQLDMSPLDDIHYLLRYIQALHNLIQDVYIDQTSDKFEFDA